MKKNILFQNTAILACLLLIVLTAPRNLFSQEIAKSFTEWAEGAILPGYPPPSSNTIIAKSASGPTYYTSRAVFDLAFPGLPVEDFEESPVPPFGVFGCDEPIDENSSNDCFEPGDILPGLTLRTFEGIRGDCPLDCPIAVLGDGQIGNTDVVIGPNFFEDTFLMEFQPGTRVVGMDLYIPVAEDFDVTITLTSGPVMTTAAASPTGTFWGVSSDTEDILSIHIVSNAGGGELVDNVAFGGLPTGTIVIIKDAVPDTSLDFSFQHNIDTSGFLNLDDDNDPTLPNSKTYNDIIPGSYFIAEGGHIDYSASVSCIDNNTNGIPSIISGAMVTINLDPGETVTCTFTNTKQDFDFGDAPDSYGTQLPNGARHVIVHQPIGIQQNPTTGASTLSGHLIDVPHIGLGFLIDPEEDGQPSNNADGDDRNDPNFNGNHNDNGNHTQNNNNNDPNGNDNGPEFPQDDEDGVFFKTLLVKGSTAEISVRIPGNVAIADPFFSKSTTSGNTTPMPGGANLDAWIDFNNNDIFDHPDELLNLTNVIVGGGVPIACGSYHIYPGVSTLQFDVPQDAMSGPTFARFRVSTAGCLPPTGPAPDGEVEDYKVVILDQHPNDFDFGDAVDSYGTTLAVDGARHAITPDVFFGPTIDPEPDGLPSFANDGDDLNITDDEDGIIMPLVLVPGGGLEIITVHGGPSGGFLDMWIDADFNGFFDHPMEHFYAGISVPVLPNINPPEDFTPPLDIPLGLYNFRFRLSGTGGLLPTGPSPDGEVEDYLVWIVDQLININNDIAPESQMVFWNQGAKQFSFELAITNIGTQPLFAPLFIEIVTLDPLPPDITVANPDAGGSGIGAIFDFSHSLGSDFQLDPNEQTDFKPVIFNNPNAIDFNFFADVFSGPAPAPTAPSTKVTDSEGSPISLSWGNKNVEPSQQTTLAKSASKNSLGFRADVTNGRLERITITDVGDETITPIPEEFSLDQNYPNPFNPETRIRYQLPKKSDVTINIYNLQGQLIRSLVSENKEAGFHEIVWDARDDAGRTMPSGVYMYRIKANDFTEVKKLMLIR